MSFAPITEEFDTQFARNLFPAARTLWTWLRRMAPAGREIEFSLKDFASLFDYSLKWGRRALDALIDVGLVQIVRQYYGYGFKVLVFQVGEVGNKTSNFRNKTSPNRNETSKIHPSNPHSSVSIDPKNLKEPTSIEVTQEIAPQEEFNNEAARLIDQAAETIAPEPMNPQIVKRIQAAEAQIVKNAIELVQYRKQFGGSKIESLPGLLMQAIANKWYLRDAERQRLNQQPNEIPVEVDRPQASPAPLPQGFKEWFNLAQAVRVVKASRAVRGVVDGIEVLNSHDEWEPWEGLAVAFTLPKLRELAQVMGVPVPG
jgi:hypothetical protein